MDLMVPPSPPVHPVNNKKKTRKSRGEGKNWMFFGGAFFRGEGESVGFETTAIFRIWLFRKFLILEFDKYIKL
jgi:hypothetical protein